MLFGLFKNPFVKSREVLYQEGWRAAVEKYNIVKEHGKFYVIYNGRKVSTANDGETNGASIIDRLQEYREMYVEEYINNEGRI